MSVKLLAQLLEDEPWCGTKPRPPHPHPHAEALEAAAAPSYATRALVSAAYDAVRLYQLGHMVGGAVKDPLSEGAAALFDEYCGTVPLSELIRLMLRWPPPPPSPWTRVAESLALRYAGEALAHVGDKPLAPAKGIADALRQALETRIKGGGTGSGGPNIVGPLPIPIGPGPRRIEDVTQ
jgi:hypothetical protein